MLSNNFSDNKIDMVNSTFKMTERIILLAAIILISKTIIVAALDVKTIHRDYQNSLIVEATSTEISNINDYKDSVTYRFSYNEKKYKTERTEPKNSVKANTKSKIRINNADPEVNFPFIDESSCIMHRVLPDIIAVIALSAVAVITKNNSNEKETD